MPVPQAACDHMFPPGQALPLLKVLRLSATRHRLSSAYDQQHWVEAAQVARVAASCPALQRLSLHHVTPEGFDTSCLLQLIPGVTRVEGLDWVRPAP